MFSTLDLQSGYWQLPVHHSDCEKTAFCPGPGLGLFQFLRMPFGLSGALASFQRLMNKLLALSQLILMTFSSIRRLKLSM